MLIFHKELNRLIYPERHLLIGSIALSLLTGALIIAQAFLLSAVIGFYFPEKQAGGDRVFIMIAGFIFLAVLRALFHFYSQKLNIRISELVRNKLREAMYDLIGSLTPLQIRSRNTAEWITTLIGKVDALDGYISRYIPQFSSAVLIPFVMLLMVFFTDWFSGIVLLVTAPLIPLFMFLIGHRAEQLTRARWLSLTRMGGVFLDRVEGLMTLKYLGQAAAQQSVIEKSTKRFAEKTLSVLRVAFVSGLSLELIASVSIALIAVETGLRLMSGMMDYQYALFVLILAPEFYQPLRALGSSYHAGVEGATAMDKISEMVSGDISRKAAISAVKSMIQPPFEIRFEKVSYQYPGAKKSALEGASFTIYPNKLNALIGPSGSGKSTVSNLVLKWLTLDEGRIKVNGHPLEEIPEESWMSYISWISQHPHLFHGTIRENILAGKPGASADEFKRAVQMASLEEWIAELPAGTETMIGERGMKISQGQIQRIAIARAFLKNAPLMIFDEPANYLDPDNERRIEESIRRISPGKTLLVIAHRLKTVMESAHVILLNDGRCVAEGTYQELYNHVTEYRERFQRLTGGHDAAD